MALLDQASIYRQVPSLYRHTGKLSKVDSFYQHFAPKKENKEPNSFLKIHHIVNWQSEVPNQKGWYQQW